MSKLRLALPFVGLAIFSGPAYAFSMACLIGMGSVLVVACNAAEESERAA